MPADPRRSPAKEAPRTKSSSARTRLTVDERRTQLVSLGIEAFSERPFDEVSIDDVAQRAGISKGLLYHYFPTKRDFYVATVREIAGRVLVGTDAPTGADPRTRLAVGLRGYLAFADTHAKVYISLLRGGIGSDPEVADILERARIALIERTLSAIMPGGNVKDATPRVRLALRGWVGFVEATCLEWVTSREFARKDLLTLWVGALLDALSRSDPAYAWMRASTFATEIEE